MNNASDFDDAAAVVANNPQASAPLDTAGSAFDAAAQDVAGGARTTVRTNMLSASEHSPDDYAKAKQLGAQTGVPTDIAARNMPELKKQSDMAKYDSLFETSPKLANAFQLPDFAHLANDDVHALSGIEDAAKPQQRSIGESLVNMPYSLLQGLGLAFNKTAAGLNLTAGAAPVIYDKLVGGTSAQDWWFSRMVDPLLDQRKALEPDEQARFPEKAMHTAGDLLGMLSTITLGGTAAEGPALAATAGARETVGAAVEHGTKAMLIPAVAESIDTGRKVYEATGDAAAAIRASQMAYLTTTLGGIVPLSVPGNLATRMATGAVSGVVTGETSRELMNNSLPDQMKSPFDWENTALSAIAGSVLAVGGPRGESSKAYDAIRETYVNAARADKAEVDATALQKISAFATNSALRERDPDSFKKFVADVTEDGHLENVYIKADVLEQALLKGGVDENELRQKMPDVFAQLAEARETQGDVRIPVADYATHIAGGKADVEILPNLKTEPDGMTYLQSQEYQQQQKAELTEQAKQILAQKEADTAFKESAARVEEKLRADFDAANRFGPSINAEYSKLAAAMYTTQAARMGLTPEQMHERYPLNIRSDAVEGTPGVDQAGAPSNGIVSRVRRALDAMYNTVPEEHKSRPETEGVATMLKRGYDAFRAEPPAPQAFRDGRSGGGVTFEQNDPFYSALARGVDSIGTKVSSAGQWKATLKNLPSVKADEMNWTGLNEWLDLQQGPVTKEAIQEYLKNNGVQVKEVMLGEKGQSDQFDVFEGAAGQWAVANSFDGVPIREFDTEQEALDYRDAHEAPGEGDTKFSSYQLPGGENYRELLLTLPKAESETVPVMAPGDNDYQGFWERTQAFKARAVQRSDFISSHFDQPNILAHVRFNERTDAEGKRVLFLEELQSDWAQKGKKEGFAKDTTGWTAELHQQDAGFTHWQIKDAEGKPVTKIVGGDQESAIRKAAEGIPSGPFVGKTEAWVALSLKRMIRYAAENGFDKIAWTNGEQQAARYDLSKHIASVAYSGSNFKAFGHNGDEVISRTGVSPKDLPDLIGKDAAEKLMAQEPKGTLRTLEGQDLKVGGEGMKAFYDKIVPNVANDVLKKLGGGRVGEVVIGENREGRSDYGIKEREIGGYRAHVGDEGAVFAKWEDANKWLKERLQRQQPGFELTPEMKEKALAGQAMFQEARGKLTFGDNIREGASISLLQHADLSTFNHELGHFYLEMLTDMVKGADAPPEVRGDMNALMTWFRTDLDSWNAMDLEQKRLMHEKFARGFEAYLFEGKAPSAELTSLFGRMRAWMIAVYKQISALNVRLTDEVRGVYDRMLAADDQIRQAEATRGMFAMFDNKPVEMSDEQWVKYREESQQATAEAVSEVQRKSLADMKWLSNAKNKELRRIQKEANGARDAITEQVTAEVAKEPIYAAETWFRKGEMTDPATGDLVKAEKGFKLDSEKIAEMFPETMNSRPDLEPLKGMTGKNGLDPDLAAEMFGFRDGHQLVGELLNKVPREEIIQGMTDQRMLEEHGEMSDPTSIQRAAEAAIHNKVRARLIATELKAVAKGMGSARAMLKGATEAAEAAIAQRRIRDLRPDQHEAAEARAAKAALAAHKAADTVAAVDAKRAQLLNNRLTRASMDALDDVKKGLDYQAKFDKPTVRENIDLAFRDQIDALRNRFDFRSSMSPEAAAASRRQSLGNFVEKLAAMKFSLDVPQNLLDAANRKHFKDMTVEEFRGLIDTIKSLEHLGRAVQKVTDGTESRNVNDVAAEAQAAASKLPQRKDETNRGLSLMSSKWMKAKSYGRSIQASLLKMEQMIDWLDNYNSNGVFNRMTFQKIAKAEGARNDLDLKITKRWADAIEKMPKDVFKNGREVLEMPGVKDALTGENQRLTWHEKIALAGIRGDAEHFAKLMKGEKWDASAVLDFLDKNVSKEEWTFVHDISQTFAELFPMKTAMLRDLGSTPPKAVAHIPFKTPHGDQPGWYWPISYDPHRNYTVKERGARHEASLFEDNIFTRADTSTGREETRNENYAKPMLLSIDALPRVLKDEIRDITTRKAIIEADRFVSHPVVRDAISRALSPEHYDQINPWLTSLANDAAVKPDELQMWDRLAHGLRTRTTMVGLGFRLSTMVQHGLTAAGESIAEAGPKAMLKGTFNSKTMAAITTLGPKWMEKGIANFIRSDQFEANRDFIFERSDEMRHRSNEFERDVREQLREIQIKLADPTTRAITRAKLGVMARAYSGIAMLDMASALPTWMGGYLKAMEKVERGGLGMTEEQAVYFADKTVRNAHGGGGIKDMAAIQRGKEFQKLFTMFYTFWNHNVNRLIDTGKRVGELPGGIRAGTVTTGDVGTLVLRTFMYTLGVQAIHGMMHPPKDGEEDSWLKWIGKALGQSAFGGIPILRDFSNHYLGGKDYEASPIASVAHAGDAVLKDMEGTSKTHQYIKHALTTAGYVFGLPLGQPASTAQFLGDVWDGQQNPRDIAEWWQGISTGKVHH